MHVRRSRKVFMTMLLAMIAVFAMFGAASAANYTISRATSALNNIGDVTTNSGKIYFLNGVTTGSVTAVFDIDIDTATPGETVIFNIDSVSSSGSIAPGDITFGGALDAGITINGAGNSTPPTPGSIVIPLSKMPASGNIVIEIKGTSGGGTIPEGGFTLTLTPTPVTPVTVTPAAINFTQGVTDTTIGQTATFTWNTNVTSSGTTLINTTDSVSVVAGTYILGSSPNGIIASVLSLPTSVNFKTDTSGTGSAGSKSIALRATGLTYNDGTINNIDIAGNAASTNLVSFTVAVGNASLTLTPASKTFVVGTAPTASDNVAVSYSALGARTFSTLTISDANVTTGHAISKTLAGMTIATDVTNNTSPVIKFSTAPTATASATTYQVRATLSDSTILTGTLTVTINATGTYALSLDPDSSFTGVVSKDIGTQTRKVVIKQSGTAVTPTLTGLVVSADSVSGATGSGTSTVKWNGLTISTSMSSPATGSVGTLTVTGTPNVTTSETTFYVVAKSASFSSDINTSFKIKINSGTISVSPATQTYYVGSAVSSGTALTVTSSPQITALTIKKDGESGNGSSSSTWNDLTFAVTSTSKVSVVGTPKTTGTQKFILTGTSGSGTVTTSFTVTVAQSGGSVTFDPNPAIYDVSGNRVYTMTVGEMMKILFDANANLSNIYIYVEKPDKSPDDVLPQISVPTGNNGFIVNAAMGLTDITTYYRPLMSGYYTFKIYYTYNGVQYVERITLSAGGAHSGGSSGCDAGLGMMALFALGGLALIHRRKG